MEKRRERNGNGVFLFREGERAERQGLRESMVVELERERGSATLWRVGVVLLDGRVGVVFPLVGKGLDGGTLGRIVQVCTEGKKDKEEVYVRGRQGHNCRKSGKELAVVG